MGYLPGQLTHSHRPGRNVTWDVSQKPAYVHTAINVSVTVLPSFYCIVHDKPTRLYLLPARLGGQRYLQFVERDLLELLEDEPLWLQYDAASPVTEWLSANISSLHFLFVGWEVGAQFYGLREHLT